MTFVKAAALVGTMAVAASAHGTASGWVANDAYYEGYSPSMQYSNPAPEVIGWSVPEDLDNGYVSPANYTTQNIICHKDATNAPISAEVAAGSDVQVEWTTWPESHKGPVLCDLALCDGDCADADKTTLNFFRIGASGLVSGSMSSGTWATDALISNNNTGACTIPSDIVAGNYVLRHEIIALHGAGSENGAQNYPQCANLKVTGSGTATPSGKPITEYYTETDPGILVNIYTDVSTYTIPGPTVYSGGSGSSATSAVASSAAATSAVATSAAASSAAATSAAVETSAAATSVAATSAAAASPVAASSSAKACKAKSSSVSAQVTAAVATSSAAPEESAPADEPTGTGFAFPTGGFAPSGFAPSGFAAPSGHHHHHHHHPHGTGLPPMGTGVPHAAPTGSFGKLFQNGAAHASGHHHPHGTGFPGFGGAAPTGGFGGAAPTGGFGGDAPAPTGSFEKRQFAFPSGAASPSGHHHHHHHHGTGTGLGPLPTGGSFFGKKFGHATPSGGFGGFGGFPEGPTPTGGFGGFGFGSSPSGAPPAPIGTGSASSSDDSGFEGFWEWVSKKLTADEKRSHAKDMVKWGCEEGVFPCRQFKN